MFDVVDARVEGRHLQAVVVVGERSGVFAGHFPGRPVLPAVAHLAIVTRLAAEHLLPACEITAVDLLRVSRPVRPDDRLELVIEHDPAAGLLTFSATRAGEPVSDGRLRAEPACR